MLVSLHVKNLALMEEAEVEFGDGLNILSGETGAGKSIIIGSINLALGEKRRQRNCCGNRRNTHWWSWYFEWIIHNRSIN